MISHSKFSSPVKIVSSKNPCFFKNFLEHNQEFSTTMIKKPQQFIFMFRFYIYWISKVSSWKMLGELFLSKSLGSPGLVLWCFDRTEQNVRDKKLYLKVKENKIQSSQYLEPSFVEKFYDIYLMKKHLMKMNRLQKLKAKESKLNNGEIVLISTATEK